MSNVFIVGRRWFRRGPGTTYHSVEIYADGKFLYKVPYAYGYNDQYEWTAAAWLESNGYMPGREHRENGSIESPWQYFQRNGIDYHHSVTDVSRKKDL